MKHKLIFFIITLGVFLGINVKGTPTQEQLRDQENDFYQKQITNRLWYQISGTIVDEKGNPITNVTAEVIENQDIFGGSKQNTRTEIIKDGKFDLTSKKGCQSFSVTFRKEGFYSVDISADNEFENIIEGSAKYDGKLLISAPKTVVMMAKGEMVRNMLKNEFRGSANLERMETPNRTSLELITEYPFWPVSSRQERENTIYNVMFIAKKESDLPENIIYFWPQYSKNGIPVSVILKTNIPDTGFIMMENIDFKSFSREMNMAPEEGYEDEITIPIDLYAHNFFFYLKIDDHYGKIKVSFSKEKYHGNIYVNMNKNSRNTNFSH